jgi:hypothetical protein
MRILLVKEYGDTIAVEISAALSEVSSINYNELTREEFETEPNDLTKYDVVMSYGPHLGRMMPILRRVGRRGDDRSPRFVWWLNENPIDWRIPRPVAEVGGRVRLLVDVAWERRPGALRDTPLPRLLRMGHRSRIYGELMWAHRHGLPDVLAVTSARRVEWLRTLGIEGIHVPTAYGPGYGRDLGLPRDIPVAWIGIGSQGGFWADRRARVLARLTEDLARRGVAVQHWFGGLHGEERTEVLNRTKVLLNLLQHPQDFTGHRLLLGAANKALVASEPMVDSEPLQPGRHMIQAPVEDLADRIVYYLEHEDERRRITEAAYELATDRLSMPRALETIFRAAGLPVGSLVMDQPA